jgi:2-polyprenyl-6-methoxyphenol hydroxylase-like FAD-dependent oxidoreductase
MIDTLVVGAGPTGLTLAGELCRYGARVRLVDRAPEISPLSRAIGVQARTLEIFDELGVAEALCAAGVKLRGATLRSGGSVLASVDFDELDSPYPFILSLPQDRTERILTQLLEQRGGRVERGVELTALAPAPDHVDAALSTGERVRARFLVGCDGAHSTVRKAAGLGFEGDAFPEAFLLADVRLAWELPADRIATFFHEDGACACFPLPGDRWRIVASGAAEGEPTLDDVRRVLATRSGLAATVEDATWLAVFRIQSRQVSSYRGGRIFVAGDAAHIHSPVGGQGMNTGIQDAHNLGWKLAHVLRGLAPPSLLDSYDAERHAIGAALLATTELATRVATLKNPLARAVRDHAARFLSSLEVVQRRITREVAEVRLHYRKSPIVDDHGGGPHAGERAPAIEGVRFGEGRHTLVLLGEHTDAVAAAVHARYPVRIVALGRDSAAYARFREGAFVVRPDLYLGYRGPADEERILAHLGKVLIPTH